MRARLADARGFTLVEVLLAVALMFIVLGATLATIEQFWNTNRVWKSGERLRSRPTSNSSTRRSKGRSWWA